MPWIFPGTFARHSTQQSLVKAGTALGAKGAIAIAVGALLVLILAILVVAIGVAFQTTTAVWPLAVATDAAGGYAATGWRDDPQTSAVEFHDGIDPASPDGACPFGEHCGAPAMFDGTVRCVGWDLPTEADPSRAGGELVVSNGEDDHETLHAHLEPYRLYVQLQGRIEDDYGCYEAYRDY